MSRYLYLKQTGDKERGKGKIENLNSSLENPSMTNNYKAM